MHRQTTGCDHGRYPTLVWRKESCVAWSSRLPLRFFSYHPRFIPHFIVNPSSRHGWHVKKKKKADVTLSLTLPKLGRSDTKASRVASDPINEGQAAARVAS